ncbi:heavy-metal-associated domain-containing protein [Ornithinimicrobium sp. F0845]|uniref:heavy-metal-associated domain-containing protein n=1 Tax=Ornithinimicrobium sp. F0845 TaxID=2926412 RepID=UPI001FF2CAE8|nr:heavy-metal-associated domain-containing protein [Ornithinimicrobium sp. F0845]MCK0112157.1 heavy-metal-associated domain-containing protein [Ornithinimicrobium sp. F0845]
MNAQSQTYKLVVSGMTCEHCVASVTEELSEVSGVTDVRVELTKGGESEVFVSSHGPLDVSAAEAAVAEAGYAVVR